MARRVCTVSALVALAGLATYLLSSQWRTLGFGAKCLSSGHALDCLSGKPFDYEADLFGMRYRGNTRELIDRNIFFLGAYEKSVLFFMRDLMAALRPDNKGIFVDVGANTGQHSLFMSRFAAKVHAFEPYPPVLKRFRRLIVVNKISNIVVHPVGLGARNDTLRFYDPPEANLGTGTFVPRPGVRDCQVREAAVVNGDEYLLPRKVGRVDLIKMDIEGYEKPALLGLRHTLERDRPVVVLEVIVDPDIQLSFKELAEVLTVFPRSYEMLLFDSQRADDVSGTYLLREVPRGLSRPSSPTMVVLYPREKAAQVPRRPRHGAR